jgi:tRNA(adenine34) deaminase
VGAVFVKGGRVIAHGAKTGLVHSLFDHAEHNACYQALWSREGPRNLEGFTVYSTLEPCLMCLSMLMTTRVSRIVYACEDPYGGGCRLLENPALLPMRFQKERPVAEGGLLQAESKELLRRFFSSEKRLGQKNWSDPDNPLIKLVMS